MAVLSTLRIGSQGPMVEFLQLALTRASFSPGGIDGIFGSATYSAVRRFQAANGLRQDGIVGPNTWQALSPYMYGYVVYTVRPGDTLYSIAMRYRTTLKAVETANPGIDPLSLRIGQNITVPLPFEVVPTNISFTSVVLEFCVMGLRARYPFLQTGQMGRSVMGKPLYYLSIGSGPNEVFYNASHHANEWITSPLLMKFLENYCRSYALNAGLLPTSATELYSASTLYLAPMVDPDGVDLVTGLLNSGRYYNNARALSQNYPTIPFPSGWKANINGIDLNLQYPAGWENAREIKFEQGFTSPGPRDYVGSAPLVAQESRAVYDFTLSHDFTLTLSYHSQGRVIYWKYLDYLPPMSEEIAQRFGQLSGYAVEETPYASGYAGYKDWFISYYYRPGYTIEVGLGTSPLPLSQFDGIYAENLGILTYGLTATA